MTSPIVVNRMRDQLRQWVPWWLQDRFYSSGKTVGWRFLWAMIACLDYYAQWLLEGLIAAWPGAGTSTALPLIGRSRGIIRGQTDTDAQYAGKLVNWLGKWSNAGSAAQMAIEIHEYLANRPAVTVITRSGVWAIVDVNGNLTTTTQAFNWDSLSNPERAGYWSELWIVVYPSPWANSGTWGDGRKWGARDSGLGHQNMQTDRQTIIGLTSQWKSAHSKIRAVIWTTDATMFNPAYPANLPDGNWGEWRKYVSGSAVASRNTTTCRYWDWEN